MGSLHRWLRAMVCCAALAATLVSHGPQAHGYEFEVRARTIGQGYSLRSFRLLSNDLLLARRRFTQVLSLNLWDLTKPRGRRGLFDAKLERGPKLYFTSYLRIEHDFGGWTGGGIVNNNRVFDAVDLVPELGSSNLGIDLLFGYFAAEGLLGGRVDLYIGRQLNVDTLDWWSMDGLTIRVATPAYMSVEAFGGLRVRDSSPLGSATNEPDGTSSAFCAEYVEGLAPGSGSWRPIDRNVPGTGNPFTNDFDFCPQREQLMPTFGGAVETAGLGPVWARLAYRRSQSPTPGVIGDPFRFEFEDVGLYPNESGQAPDWGVNEERVSATVRTNIKFAKGKGQAVPYAAARYSLLHGLVDQAHAGARLRYGAHSIESEVYYSFPTFDGDSIFNVFSTEPFVDYRMTYDIKPKQAAWRAYARGWVRKFDTEDADTAEDGVMIDPSEYAGGVQVGARYLRKRTLLARVDLFHDDGYGGRRTGGYAEAQWNVSSRFGVASRLSLIDMDAGGRNLVGKTYGAQLGTTYRVQKGVTLHLLGEGNLNRFNRNDFRAIVIMDLAFNPES